MHPYVVLLSAFALLLSACSKIEAAGPPKKNTVSVNVIGVNYTAEPFRYVLVDATNPANGTGGGGHMSPFDGGGISCCVILPERWRPGIMVKVHSTHWLSEKATEKLVEVAKTYTFEVPAYPNGSAGDLWVLRSPDGTIELVASNVEPDHPQWPGKVKGWPEPSLEYRRERWELYREIAQSKVDLYRKSLEHLRNYPQAHLQNSWDFDKEHNSEIIGKFLGPDDPAYAEYQKKSDIEGLRRSEEKLEQLLREKP